MSLKRVITSAARTGPSTSQSAVTVKRKPVFASSNIFPPANTFLLSLANLVLIYYIHSIIIEL